MAKIYCIALIIVLNAHLASGQCTSRYCHLESLVEPIMSNQIAALQSEMYAVRDGEKQIKSMLAVLQQTISAMGEIQERRDAKVTLTEEKVVSVEAQVGDIYNQIAIISGRIETNESAGRK